MGMLLVLIVLGIVVAGVDEVGMLVVESVVVFMFVVEVVASATCGVDIIMENDVVEGKDVVALGLVLVSAVVRFVVVEVNIFIGVVIFKVDTVTVVVDGRVDECVVVIRVVVFSELVPIQKPQNLLQ